MIVKKITSIEDTQYKKGHKTNPGYAPFTYISAVPLLGDSQKTIIERFLLNVLLKMS